MIDELKHLIHIYPFMPVFFKYMYLFIYFKTHWYIYHIHSDLDDASGEVLGIQYFFKWILK